MICPIHDEVTKEQASLLDTGMISLPDVRKSPHRSDDVDGRRRQRPVRRVLPASFGRVVGVVRLKERLR